MSAYFQPEELRVVLDQLARDPYEEELHDRRFRDTYSPFNPVHHGHRDGDHEVQLSEMPVTPRPASRPVPVPTMASGQQSSTPYPVGAGSDGENQALETENIKQIGQIGIYERIRHWRRSSCQWPLPNAPVAGETRYAASVDQLEILTEIASSYSGSTDGNCIHANGDIEIHGTCVSPVPQQTTLNPPVKKTKGTIKGGRTQGNIPTPESSPKNDDEHTPGKSNEGNQQINTKESFSKRRRSARIAALTKAGK
ncbi:hypothetical protein P170DRAFT_470715 [Aspergillus steynii IBT 23096]|uniref:Uncharacterized protein n=1 Tax=Aspergillus steynii IBT 23096 TaxID=1392250 RepID=A0A2I2GQY9_9EURO|nr:uncharacterized protein P170DRAFT_470715 [Aspergillus steynii IBT 23096]PLB55296.1 hypothetical protein P170DRAFT_470715 [Aspergillus steynii IBT 23096]